MSRATAISIIKTFLTKGSFQTAEMLADQTNSDISNIREWLYALRQFGLVIRSDFKLPRKSDQGVEPITWEFLAEDLEVSRMTACSIINTFRLKGRRLAFPVLQRETGVNHKHLLGWLRLMSKVGLLREIPHDEKSPDLYSMTTEWEWLEWPTPTPSSTTLSSDTTSMAITSTNG